VSKEKQIRKAIDKIICFETDMMDKEDVYHEFSSIIKDCIVDISNLEKNKKHTFLLQQRKLNEDISPKVAEQDGRPIGHNIYKCVDCDKIITARLYLKDGDTSGFFEELINEDKLGECTNEVIKIHHG
jgi:succinate dehydrogenase/fumarate reductase-like Fe-S protein